MRLTSTIRPIAALCILTLLTACAGKKHNYATPGEAYDAKDYQASLEMASDEADSTKGTKQEQAALIAGMSAHALKNNSEAERWLKPLTQSEDPLIAGRAAAELGLIQAEQGRHEAATKLFATAATKLDGNEEAHAEFLAGESYTALGRNEMAKLAYRRALSEATDPAFKTTIESRLALGGYTLQLGAFADKFNAEKAASKAQPTAQKLGLDQPRVVPRSGPNGKTLYAVQVGSFNSKTDADKARGRYGSSAVVTRVSTN